MPAGFRAYRVLLFSVLFFLVIIVSISGETHQQVAGKSAQSASSPVANALSADVSKYVGAETCKPCHEDLYNSWAKTPHTRQSNAV